VESGSQVLREKTIKGFQWNLAAQSVVYVISLIGTVVMTRLLSPAQVGLFGMLAVLSSLASLFISLGLAHAIVQCTDLDDRDLSSIFWINLLIAAVVALVFFLGANLIATFYRQPELALITRWYSLIFLIYGASAVPLGLLSKQMRFRELAISQLAAATLSYIVGIILAVYGFGVWSLVAQALCNHGLYVGLNLYFCRWRPTGNLDKNAIRKIAGFIGPLLPSQMLDFFALNFDLLLVGKFFGKSELGLYGRATSLVQLPVNSLGVIFNKTFFPVFSTFQQEPYALSFQYLRATRFLTFLLIPLLVIIAISAEKIIWVLFGAAWLATAPLTTWLAVAAIAAVYSNFNDTLLTAQGRTSLLLRVNVVEKCLLLVAMIVGLQFGILGILSAKIGITLIMFLPKLWVITSVLGQPLAKWFSVQGRLFFAILFAGVAAFGVNEYLSNSFLSLAAVVATGYGVFFVVLGGLREPTFFEGIRTVTAYVGIKKDTAGL
jgi:PST family polysaccharide transporter